MVLESRTGKCRTWQTSQGYTISQEKPPPRWRRELELDKGSQLFFWHTVYPNWPAERMCEGSARFQPPLQLSPQSELGLLLFESWRIELLSLVAVHQDLHHFLTPPTVAFLFTKPFALFPKSCIIPHAAHGAVKPVKSDGELDRDQRTGFRKCIAELHAGAWVEQAVGLCSEINQSTETLFFITHGLSTFSFQPCEANGLVVWLTRVGQGCFPISAGSRRDITGCTASVALLQRCWKLIPFSSLLLAKLVFNII